MDINEIEDGLLYDWTKKKTTNKNTNVVSISISYDIFVLAKCLRLFVHFFVYIFILQGSGGNICNWMQNIRYVLCEMHVIPFWMYVCVCAYGLSVCACMLRVHSMHICQPYIHKYALHCTKLLLPQPPNFLGFHICPRSAVLISGRP